MADGTEGAGDIVYSGTYTNGIVLSNPTAQNPTTIAASGLVTNSGPAIYGSPGTAWTVANYGTVEASGTGVNVSSIDLASGGLVVNSASGLVAAPSLPGAVSIHGSATYGAAGTVTNYGTIKGGAHISFPASYYYSNPTLGIVLNTGTIAGATGVSIVASDGTVLNYGRIAGTLFTTYYYPGEVDHSPSMGTVVNFGTIAGKQFSVDATAAVVNYGVLNGGLYGGGEFNDGVLALYNYGIVHARKGSVTAETLTNYGVIRSIGTQAAYSFGQVTNYGTIADASGNGLRLDGGGLVNGQYGEIKGGETGVLLHSFKNTLFPSYSDSIVNYGTIAGSIGVEVDGSVAATVVNAGTIIGTGGTAVSFVNSGDVLITDPGAVFVGAVVGDPSTLELAAGSGPGTLTGLGTSFTDFPAIDVAPSADWIFTTLDSNAAVTVTLDSGASAEFAGPVGTGQSVTFAGGAGELKLDDPGGFAGTIGGFGAGDTIDLVRGTADGLSFAGNRLTVTSQGVMVADLAFSGNYTTADFALSPDGHGGTDITFAADAARLLAMKG